MSFEYELPSRDWDLTTSSDRGLTDELENCRLIVSKRFLFSDLFVSLAQRTRDRILAEQKRRKTETPQA